MRMLGVDPGAAMAQLQALSGALAQTAANTAAIAQSLGVIDRRLARLESEISGVRAELDSLPAERAAVSAARLEPAGQWDAAGIANVAPRVADAADRPSQWETGHE